MPMFPYKSFCWAVGTTSFRTVEFNARIERQLGLLNEFWALPENANVSWSGNSLLQMDYYRFIKKRGFIVGDAPNPAKDAREKTSGLFDIGLIDSERRLTEAGQALLQIAQNGDFDRDNPLQIPRDSFIYLKQLLKMHDDVEGAGEIVRPYVVAIYMLIEFGYLTREEFTYLLPLCTNQENSVAIADDIRDYRQNNFNIDLIILTRLMAMDNYKAALAFFLKAEITEDVICEIGINRKSRQYDRPYFKFYKLLKNVVLGKDETSIWPLYLQCKEIKNKPGVYWRDYLFNSTLRKPPNDSRFVLNDFPLMHATNEMEFRQLFFEQLHLFKARATLSDYADLNERYFKTTDTMIFADGKVELDILPKVWLANIKDKLLDIAFVACPSLTEDIDLLQIAPFLAIDEKDLYSEIERQFGIKITDVDDVADIISDERHKRFNEMIDKHFKTDDLIELFAKFEMREDDSIRKAVTSNADIPTMFEYILGIAWYRISGRKGNILDYMKLSLEADLLPRTHAAGGNADIEYLYEATSEYPAHCLLLEATLADNSNQRRMEMEPVSRHLGEYILRNGEKNAYCVFASTHLDINVINDFRGRKIIGYFDRYTMTQVTDMKIIPIDTIVIQAILRKGICYEKLYKLFEAAYHSETAVPRWYGEEIVNGLNRNEQILNAGWE